VREARLQIDRDVVGSERVMSWYNARAGPSGDAQIRPALTRM